MRKDEEREIDERKRTRDDKWRVRMEEKEEMRKEDLWPIL